MDELKKESVDGLKNQIDKINKILLSNPIGGLNQDDLSKYLKNLEILYTILN